MNDTNNGQGGAGMTSPADLEALVERVVSRARELGATQAEAGVSADKGLSATVRLGEVDTLEYHRDRSVYVSVYFGQQKGTATSADISAEAVENAVAKACSIATHTAADEYAGLAPADRMAGELPDLDLVHDWDMSAERAIEIARDCEEAARSHDERIQNSEGATVSSHTRLQVYGNSHGLVAGYPSSYHSIMCSVIGNDAEGMQRDYWYSVARDPGELDSPQSVGRTAAERTVRRLGSRKMPTCKAPVVYPANLARGLIGHFLSTISGGNQYRKTSFFLGAKGETLFPGNVNICERPLLKKGMGSAAMDSEGVATADRDLVTDGVLQGYILSSYSARRLGLETTGNAGGVHNVLVSGEAGRNEKTLLADMGTGFLVTELIGRGVNPTTGDYSRGAAGFWVENGEIAYPVHEVTIAGNLCDMYRNIVAIGDDIDPQSKVRCGSILMDELTIAGS